MVNKINLTVPSTLLFYASISITWYLIVNLISVNVSNINYIVWPAIALTIVWFCKFTEHYFGRCFNSFIGNAVDRTKSKELIILTIIFILAGIGCGALLIVIESAIDPDYAIKKWNLIPYSQFHNIKWSNSWIIIMVITSSIIIPISEELVFRGLILNRLMEKYSTPMSVLLSSLIFAAFHYHKSYIGSFFHGIILAIVAIKYASLYYPIIIHGVYNSVIFLAEKYTGLLFAANVEKIAELKYWAPELSCLFIGILLTFYYQNISNKVNSS